MSYARASEPGSDVYVFLTTGGLECCGCDLRARVVVEPDAVRSHGLTTDEMIAHLRRHQDVGDGVTEETFWLIEGDRAEIDAAVRR